MTEPMLAEPPTLPPPSDLDTQVEDGKRQIRADGYAMSLGELASLYDEGELEIRPKFQRFFRWTTEQKTRLVESILLGIPLSQIFVSQRDDGAWEVVDGLQQLSTLFEFMGKLRGEGGAKEPLRLTKAKYLPALDGIVWDDLSHSLRIDFRRAKVNVSILNRGSDSRAKYDLFERLNTGGTSLSEQEVRNCILLMENETFYDWLQSLSETESFRRCADISERLEREGYYMELACRLLCFSSANIDDLTQDIGPFVTDRMVDLATGDVAKRSKLEHAFQTTFDLLDDDDLGSKVFQRYSPDRDRFSGPFLLSPFEIVACGISHHLLRQESTSTYEPAKILKETKNLWTEGGLLAGPRTGMSAKQRLRQTIPYGRECFAP